jgi:hypothetical protein
MVSELPMLVAMVVVDREIENWEKFRTLAEV